LWQSKKTDLMVRTLAVATYPFLARDAAGVRDLGKIAADNTEDDMLRTEAATAFARLSSEKKDITILVDLAKKYFAASDKKTKSAATQTDPKARKNDERAAKAYTGYAHIFLTHSAR